MALKDITFNQVVEGKYVSDPIQVNQESIGLRLNLKRKAHCGFISVTMAKNSSR